MYYSHWAKLHTHNQEYTYEGQIVLYGKLDFNFKISKGTERKEKWNGTHSLQTSSLQWDGVGNHLGQDPKHPA